MEVQENGCRPQIAGKKANEEKKKKKKTFGNVNELLLYCKLYLYFEI